VPLIQKTCYLRRSFVFCDSYTTMIEIKLNPHKKIYFASDFHLGVPTWKDSLPREQKIVRWLDTIKTDAQAVILVGDIFDFWFEYKTAIPKGYIRFQGKLAELVDAGIEVMFFTGNHDLWMFGYFTEALGIPVFHEPQQINIITENAIHHLYVGHGDGLGPGDYHYKFLKKIFTNRLAQWAFGWLHPNIGMGLAHLWSDARKTEANIAKSKQFHGETGEWLYLYAKEIEAKQHHDYYIFGHRHLPLDMKVSKNSRYINTGEWLSDATYAFFDGHQIALSTFEKAQKEKR
jgi:UDP-2,3-diacylglucosamine hydrolase